MAHIPSSDFIAQNQLAIEGSQTVSPVNILAVTTIVNFKRCQTHLLPVQVLKNAGTHFPKLNRVQFGQTFPRCHPTGFQIFLCLMFAYLLYMRTLCPN